MTRARNSANLASQGNLFVDIANDRTGIGSVVPAQNLHVAGTAGFHADTTFVGDLYNATWDRSENRLKFDEFSGINFGNNNELQINHRGTSYILNIDSMPLQIGSNSLQLMNAGTTQTYLNASLNSDLLLYRAGSERFRTKDYGVQITGTTDTDGLVVSGVATVTTMNVTGVLTYDDVTSIDSVGIVTARQGVRVTADGSSSSNYISVGASNDLKLYHDGSHSFVENTTGLLILQDTSGIYLRTDDLRLQSSGGSETYATLTKDGAVSLNFDNSTRFATSSTGVSVTGAIASSGNLSISNVAPKIFLTDTDSNSDFAIRNMHGVFGIHDSTNSANRLTINSSGNATFSGDLTVSGNLSVTGTTTQNNSVSTAQKTITLASGAANNAAVDGAGIVVDAGSDTDKTLKWLDSTDRWTFTGGDVSANAYYGDGSNLTGIAADRIFEGNTEAEVVDTGSDGHFKVTTEGSERLRIDSSGRLTVGATGQTSNGIAEFHRDIGGGAEGCHILVRNTSTNSVNNTARLKLQTSGGTAQFYAFATGITELRSRVGGTADWKIRADGAASTRFFTNGNERVKIDSSGNLLVGTAAIQYASSPLYVSGTDPTVGELHHSDGGTGDEARLILGALANNPPSNRGAGIAAVNNGAGHDLVIKCSPSHGLSPTEMMRVRSTGQIGINTTTGGLVAVAVDSSNTNPLATGFIALALKNTNTNDNTSVCMDFNNSVGGIVGRFGAQFKDTSDKDTDLYFATRQDGGVLSERLRIFSDGRVQIAGQNNIATTSLSHRLLVRAQNDSHAIAIAGRNGDHIGELGFYQSDASTRLGEIQAHTTHLELTSRVGYLSLQSNGATERVRISSNELRFNSTAQQIHLNTSDGSDNGFLNIGAAGAANNQTRAAQAVFYGNEYSGAQGRLGLLAGNSGNSNGYIYFNTGGTERLRILQDGVITCGHGGNRNLHGSSTAGICLNGNGNSGQIIANADGNRALIIGRQSSFGQVIEFFQGSGGSNTNMAGITIPAADTLGFETNGSEKFRINNSGWLSIFSNTGTIGNPIVPLDVRTTSTQQQLFYFYKGSTIAHRVAHDNVSDNFGSGNRTFIGDTGSDLFLGTSNGSLTPNNSFIALNHSGNIRMCADASPQAEEGITLRAHSLQYNVTNNLNTAGNNRTTNDKVSIRAGTMNSTTVNDDVTAIKIFPAAPRNTATYTKGGGIAWQHLDPHNWNGYSGSQFWMGLSLHSTPGQEFSYLETVHNSNSTAGSQPTNVGLRIYPNGNVTTPSSAAFLAGGVNNYSGFPGNGVWKTYYTNTEYFDRGNDFDHTTGTFTAPADGAYFFHVSGLIYPMGANNFGQAKWVRNGSQYGQYMQFNGTDGNHRNFSYEIVMEMSTNDTCHFQIWRTSGQSWSLYNSQFNFGGFLIG